jgi:hypothetical protein
MTHFLNFHTDWHRFKPKPSDVKQSVLKYLKKHPSRPTGKYLEVYKQALSIVAKKYRLPVKVKPYHIKDVIRRYPHPDRSPGLPYTKQGYRRKDEVPIEKVLSSVHRMKYSRDRIRARCNAVAKTLVSPPDRDKFRLIWVYPMDVTMAECMFAFPLVKAYQAAKGSYAIWCQYGKGDLAHLRTKLPDDVDDEYWWLGIDFKDFDINLTPWLMRDAFGIVYENINFKEYDGWGKPTHPDTLERLFWKQVRFCIDTPVQCPDGETVVKHGGMPSGSGYTNLVDSICSAIMKVFAFLLCTVKYLSKADWEMGDDNLTAVKRKTVDLEKLSKCLLENFGAEMHPDKCEFGKKASFLGYGMQDGMNWRVPVAKYEKLVAQLLLPSVPDRSVKDMIVRANALVLSSFVRGCPEFTQDVISFYSWLNVHPDLVKAIYSRSDIYTRMEYLGIDPGSSWSRILTACGGC